MSAMLPLPPAVLLVDDEPYARQLVMSQLLMYLPADTILSASDGRHALQYLDTCAIRLLITDHQMPNLTGLELIDIVRERYPDTCIILISGDVDNHIERCGSEHGADYILMKPFCIAELRGILEQVLPPARNERAVASS
jgi:two-component system chemotaxis response regulator CheY